MFDQLVEEFRKGEVLKLVNAKKKQVASAAAHGERSFLGDQGEVQFQIRPEYFHHWGQRLGYECWDDPQFIREFLRDNPECRIDSRSNKIQSGYGGGPRATGSGRRKGAGIKVIYGAKGEAVSAVESKGAAA